MNKNIWLLLLLIVIVNIIADGVFQLHYDEAYYWVWGQHLSWSYFDHPPMIAYLIRFVSIFGHNELTTRFPALVCALVTTVMIYRLSFRLFGVTTASIAMLLAISLPLMEAMFFIVTPDCPLLMFWVLTLYAFYLGVFEERTVYIYVAGVFAGLALLSKYTACLIYPGLFLFLLTNAKYRKYLLTVHMYLAFVLSIVIFSPVILWNYTHNWVSFLYQIHHGIEVRQIDWHNFGDYWGGQLLVAGPIIFLALLYYTIVYCRNNLKDPKLSFLFWNFVFGIAFFAGCGLFKHMEANWTAPAYISGVILLAYYLEVTNNKWIYRSSLALILFVLLVTKFPLQFAPKSLKNKIPGVNVFFANKELLLFVKPLIKPGVELLACDYGNASRAWYYLNLHRTYVLSDFQFANAYRYWLQDSARIDHGIYICDGEDITALNTLKKHFHSIKKIDTMTYSNQISDYKLYIYKVDNN